MLARHHNEIMRRRLTLDRLASLAHSPGRTSGDTYDLETIPLARRPCDQLDDLPAPVGQASYAKLEEVARRLRASGMAPAVTEELGPAYQVAVPPAVWSKVQVDPAFLAARQRGEVLDRDTPWWDGGWRLDQETGERRPFFDPIPGQRFLLMRVPSPAQVH